MMEAAGQKTEQPILSKEWKEDKELKLSNKKFKEIIETSIRQINSRGKLSALKEQISYPNNYVFASLAERSYSEKKKVIDDKEDLHEKEVLDNWRLLTVAYSDYKFSNGYVGAAYWNSNMEQVIIVHRGSQNVGSFFTDFKGVFLNQHDSQINSAITFTDRVIGVLKKLNEDTGSNIQLFITGHSLGAWLAPITAFYASYLKKNGDYFVANDNFERTGYHASTVIFDGPGCEEVLRRIQRELMNLKDFSFINSLDIIHYLSAPNLINACNLHIGEVYRIFINLSQEEKNSLQKMNIISYTLFTHQIIKIKEVFSPQTGEVLDDENGKLRIKKVLDWPLLISKDERELYRSNFLWCIKEALKLVPIVGQTIKANELYQELKSFFKPANKSNDFHLDDESTRVKIGENYYRTVHYKTQDLDKDYKNERSLNVFTNTERKFLEGYKFLENLNGLVTLEKLFDSIVDKELISDTMKILKSCKIDAENGVVHSKNLNEFILYVKRLLHHYPEIKKEIATTCHGRLDNNIRNEFYQLISSSYLQPIKDSLDFGRDNFGLKAFLDSNLNILHTVQSSTSLGATRVYKTFNQVRNDYSDKKCHAFINLDRIFYLGEEIFINFLKKIDHNYLLVIECDHMLNDKDDMLNSKIKEFLNELFKALNENHNIKVILVTERDSDRNISNFVRTCNELSILYQEKCIEARFNDLTSDSQKKLLEKPVIFQGKEVPLSTVININSDGDLDTIIDPEIINELFKNKKIEVGKVLPSLGETKDYYIDRKLVKKVKVKEEVLKDDNLTDLFAISNIDKEGLSEIVKGGRVLNFGEEDPDRSNPIRFIKLSENAEENFKHLCDEYSDRTIHWLKKENNVGLIWQKSHGKTLSGLRRYIENYESDLPEKEYSENNTSIKIVDVNDISKFNEKLIVVAAEPGMGKTTVLTRLGIQRTDDSKWLIRMNLVEYKDKLEQNDFSEEDNVVTFLHKNNIVSNTLTKKLLKSRLDNSGNIVFLLDGFDEITSEGQKSVVNLIKQLQETKVEKVFISTRLHLRNELENSLSTVAYTLKPFSRKDQEQFLGKFWRRDLDPSVEEHLDNYINKLLEFISKSIGDKERKFMGIPMQMRMVAEAFQEVTKDQELLDNPERTFPKNFDVLKLYDCFVDAKYRAYFGKIGAKGVNLNNPTQRKWFTTRIKEAHERLSFKELFSDIKSEVKNNIIGEELIPETDKQEICLVGIAQFIDDRIIFIHRTFEEYFAANFLADRLNQKNKNKQEYDTTVELLAKELFESKNEVIKTFLDHVLAKEEIHVAILKGKLDDLENILSEENINVTDNLGRNSLHYAAQEGNKEIVDILLNKANIKKLDELGKTALHYAARYNRKAQIVSCLLKRAKDCINNKDNNGRTPVYYAAQQGNWDIVDRILTEKGASVEGLDEEKLLFHYTYKGSLDGIQNIVGEKEMDFTAFRDNHDNTLLHIATQKGHLTVVEFLLEKGVDVGVANYSGKRSISYAAEHKDWNIAKSLLRKKANFNDLNDDQKLSLLKYSSENTHWDIVKLFMEDNGKANYFSHLDSQQKVELLCDIIRFKDLHTKDFDIAKFLIEKGTAANSFDENGKRPMYYAAENEHWNIVQVLLRNNFNFKDLENAQKNSLLLYSARNFNWDIVKLFMEDNNRGNFLNLLDGQQKVGLLCNLICSEELDIAKFLIEQGTKVDSFDSNGKKPISYAAENEHWNIVELLLRKNAEFNDLEDTQKDLLLYYSIENSTWSTIQLFMKGYCIDNYFNQLNGQQKVELLCYLIRSGNFDVAKLVIERGAEVNSSDSNSKKPINYAAENGNWNIVELLLRNNANFNNLENAQKNSLLHYSARNFNWDIVKLFMEDNNRVNFLNLLDGQQKVGLLCNLIFSEELDIAKFLIEQGTKVDSSDSNGKKPISYAAENEHWNIVELLLRKNAVLNDLEDTQKDLLLYYSTENSSWSTVQLFMKGNYIYKYFHRLNGQQKVELLCYLIRSESSDIAKLVIERGTEVNSSDSNSKKPINYAAENGNWNIVELLLRNNANFNNLENAQKNSLLCYSAQNFNWDIVKLFIEDNSRNNYFDQLNDQQRMCCLYHFIDIGNLGITKFFIEQLIIKERICSINVSNNCGETCLHLAAKKGKLDIAQYLINEKRADLTVTSTDGKTPKDLATEKGYTNVVKFLEEAQQERLFDAAKQGNLGVIKTLVDQGVNVNAIDNNKWTSLHFAAYNGHLELVEYLLKKGANVFRRNNHDTVLHLAVRSNKEELIKLILDKIKEVYKIKIKSNLNQYVDAQDTEGNSPLMWAAEGGRTNAAQILLEYGASIEVKNNDGMTAVHWTAKNGYLGIAQLLAEKGANIDATDNNGRKPIHVAALHGHRNVIELFLNRGVSVNDTDKHGWTPLHYAVCICKLEFTNFLLSRGADIDARGKNGRTAIHLAMAVEKIRQEQTSNEEINILFPNFLYHVQLDMDYVTLFTEQLYDQGLVVQPGILVKYDNRAKELYSKGKYKEALHAFKLVFCIKKRQDVLGSNHPKTLVTHMNIAVVLSKLCKYEDALKILKEVLDIQEILEDLGPNHRDTLTTRHSIAEVFYKQGKYKDALELYEEVLEKREKILEANHPDILITRHHIARVLNNRREHNKALIMFREIFELQCHILGTDHPDTLKTQHNIAFTLFRLFKYQQALSIIQEILGKSEKVLGSNHPDHLTTNHIAALIALKIGKHEDSLIILKGIFQAQKEMLGQDHSDTLATMHDIASALYSQGKSQEALTIFRKVYEKRKEILGSDHLYTSYSYSYIRSMQCSIQHYKKQQKAFLDLSKFVSGYIPHAEIESAQQGLYLPSFEKRGVKVNGKCIAITRIFSQALLSQSNKSFLRNLETSAEIYERIVQGKQISKMEEREAFAFSKLLNNFEREQDSATNSLPLYLIHTKGYKTFGDVSNYIAGFKSDFAIHLVTSNHVVAIYRTGDKYAYFDSNEAFVSKLENVDQLMQVVKKGVEYADYKVEEKGFFVEHFDVEQANKLLSNENKQILAKEIKTERQLLAWQDKELGLIKIYGQELSRVQLYDFGTKINVEGSIPLLINADMDLSSKTFQEHLDRKEVKIVAREYLDHLKDSKNVKKVMQATRLIPFEGSKREIEEAEKIRRPKQFLLEQSVKGAINFIANKLTADFFCWSKSIRKAVIGENRR